jgi:hypothetical protein
VHVGCSSSLAAKERPVGHQNCSFGYLGMSRGSAILTKMPDCVDHFRAVLCGAEEANTGSRVAAGWP